MLRGIVSLLLVGVARGARLAQQHETDSMLTALGVLQEREEAGFVGKFADWAGVDHN